MILILSLMRLSLVNHSGWVFLVCFLGALNSVSTGAAFLALQVLIFVWLFSKHLWLRSFWMAITALMSKLLAFNTVEVAVVVSLISVLTASLLFFTAGLTTLCTYISLTAWLNVILMITFSAAMMTKLLLLFLTLNLFWVYALSITIKLSAGNAYLLAQGYKAFLLLVITASGINAQLATELIVLILLSVVGVIRAAFLGWVTVAIASTVFVTFLLSCVLNVGVSVLLIVLLMYNTLFALLLTSRNDATESMTLLMVFAYIGIPMTSWAIFKFVMLVMSTNFWVFTYFVYAMCTLMCLATLMMQFRGSLLCDTKLFSLALLVL